MNQDKNEIKWNLKKFATRLYNNNVDAHLIFHTTFDNERDYKNFSYLWYMTDAKEKEGNLCSSESMGLFVITTDLIDKEGYDGKYLYCKRIDKNTEETRISECVHLFSDVKKVIAANFEFDKISYYDVIGNCTDQESTSKAKEAYMIVLEFIGRTASGVDKSLVKRRLLAKFKQRRNRLTKTYIIDRGLNIYPKKGKTIDELLDQMKDLGLLEEINSGDSKTLIKATIHGYQYLKKGLDSSTYDQYLRNFRLDKSIKN